jgi:rod shape determining protein RodA
MTLREKLFSLNWLMVLVVAGLCAFGIAFQYSVNGGSWVGEAGEHAERIVLFFVVAVVLAFVPLRWWRAAAWPAYAVSLLMLVAVEVVGVTRMGAQRWLDLGIMTIQPSEIMKMALVLALADYFHRAIENGWKGFWLIVVVPLLVTLLPVALVFHQPNLGTGLLLLASGGALIFFAGLPWRYIVGALAVLVVATPLYVLYGMHDYQRDRVMTFINPDYDPQGEGYNIAQSKIAIGAGGFWGRGYLEGSQVQNDFLPEKQTDFIFAAVAEETGFPGAASIMALYAALLAMMVSLTLNARAAFARYAMAGITVMVATYVFINLGMVMGLMPVVGIPLPLVSFGGTAIMVILAGVAFALSVGLNRDKKL